MAPGIFAVMASLNVRQRRTAEPCFTHERIGDGIDAVAWTRYEVNGNYFVDQVLRQKAANLRVICYFDQIIRSG